MSDILSKKKYTSILWLGLSTIVFGTIAFFIFNKDLSQLKLLPYTKGSEGYAFLRFVLISMLLAPIFEELAFRFWLVPRFSIFIFLVPLFLATAFSSWFLLGCAISIILIYIICKDRFNTLIQQNLKIMVIFSSICFGIAHMGNYQNPDWFLVFPLTIFVGLGFLFSYFRLRFGLLAAVLAHASWNLLAVGLDFNQIQASKDSTFTYGNHTFIIIAIGAEGAQHQGDYKAQLQYLCYDCSTESAVRKIINTVHKDAVLDIEIPFVNSFARYNVGHIEGQSDAVTIDSLSQFLNTAFNISLTSEIKKTEVYYLDFTESDYVELPLMDRMVKSKSEVGLQKSFLVANTLQGLYGVSVRCDENCDQDGFFVIDKAKSVTENLKNLKSLGILAYKKKKESVLIYRLTAP